ncbi:copper transport protein [Neorhizobium sp. 2083]|nr:copper transport protein [Neorhizobium sp. 2083]
MLVVLLLCPIPATALAHASLTATEPRDGSVVAAAPAVMNLSFSEPVSVTTLHLAKPDGTSVKLDKSVLRDRTLEITPPADLGIGTYILSWRVVSEDGHPVGGSVVFSIGQPSAPPGTRVEVTDWSVRAGLWVGKVGLYVGLFLGIGGVFAISWFADGSREGSKAILIALGLGLAGTVLSAGFQGLDTLGVSVSSFLDPAPWAAGFGTSFGRTVVFMIAALALSAVALASRPGASGRWISLGGLVAGAFALSLSGHASAAEPQWLTRPAVFLHALTISVWVGAFIPLSGNFNANTSVRVALLRLFSRSIPFAVMILAVAGVYLAVVQVREFSALLTTAYGNVLLIKLALLCALFLLAALNRWKLTTPVQQGDPIAIRAFMRSIVAETIIVLLVFGVASSWRFTPPPRALQVAAAEPASTHIHTDKAMAEVTITPGRAGVVTASAMVMTGHFSPLGAQEVSLVFSNPAAGIEPIKRKASKGDDSTWTVQDLTLPLAGTWKVRVDILIDDFNLTRLDGEIELKP